MIRRLRGLHRLISHRLTRINTDRLQNEKNLLNIKNGEFDVSNVLVTGVSGFIGRSLCKRMLADHGYQVRQRSGAQLK